jgi:putative transposase
MSRPIRINFENAYYHVMNRGRGHQTIFHGDDYYQSFLACLEEGLADGLGLRLLLIV